MFSTNGKESGTAKSGKSLPANANSVNIIGVGTHIEGEILAEGDIRIDGEIHGVVNSKAKLVIGTTGKVDGDLVCENADISGTVKGKLTVQGMLFLKGTARIDGDIITSKIVVEAGAEFNGSCSMGNSVEGTKREDSAKRLQKATA